MILYVEILYLKNKKKNKKQKGHPETALVLVRKQLIFEAYPVTKRILDEKKVRK